MCSRQKSSVRNVVDEGHVVVDPADLEDFLPAQARRRVSQFALGGQVVALVVFLAEAAAVPAVFDVAEQLDAELVGIQPVGLVAIVPRVVVGSSR